MFKNLGIWVIFLLVIITAASVIVSVTFYEKSKKIERENAELKKELNTLSECYLSLTKSYDEISKQKTYSYSVNLSPNVKNTVNSTFGTSKDLTIQYYFSLDGTKFDLKPDSVLELRKANLKP